MSENIKSNFLHYLRQLERILIKTPDEIFSLSLCENMFTLELNAKTATQFALRGYCPLLGQKTKSLFREESGKAIAQKQLSETIEYLQELPELAQLDNATKITDQAGFVEVTLTPQNYIYQYILPNFIFHISMVYAIAKLHGVNLSKGDFDGLHSYPDGFNF